MNLVIFILDLRLVSLVEVEFEPSEATLTSFVSFEMINVDIFFCHEIKISREKCVKS